MKILEDKNNELLNRREIKVILTSEKNPNFADSIKMITEHFKAQEDLVVVKEIKGKFGRDTFLISALIYKTKEDKEKVEQKKKEKKAPGA